MLREAELPTATSSAHFPALFPPKLWPHTGEGRNRRPVKWVYRIMQQSCYDQQDIDHKIRSMNAKDFRSHALWWIAHGSEDDQRSPFWHATTTLTAANRLKFSSTRPAACQGIAIRIDVERWYQEGYMPNECVIDVSTTKAQLAFFGPDPWESYDYDRDTVNRGLAFSIDRDEVLIKWRGTVPPEFCEVVNLTTGEDICPLQLVLDAIQADLDSPAQCQGYPTRILTDSYVEDLTRESQAEKARQKQAKAEREKAALKAEREKAEREKRDAEQAAADEAAMRPRSCSTRCNSKNVRLNDLRKTERARSERPSSDLRRESRPEQLSVPKKPERPPPPPSSVPEGCWSHPSSVDEYVLLHKQKESPRDLPEQPAHAWPRPGPFEDKECGSQPSNQSPRDLIRPQGAPTQLGPAPQPQSSKDVRNAETCAKAESTTKLSDQVTRERSESVIDLVPHVSQQSSTRSKSLPDLTPGAAPQSSAPVPVAQKWADHNISPRDSPAQSVRLRTAESCSVHTDSNWSQLDAWKRRQWDTAHAEIGRAEHRRNEVSKQALPSNEYDILENIRQA